MSSRVVIPFVSPLMKNFPSNLFRPLLNVQFHFCIEKLLRLIAEREEKTNEMIPWQTVDKKGTLSNLLGKIDQ